MSKESTTARPETRPPALLRTNEVAELLGINPRTVRRLADAGELTRIRLGRRTCRYAPDDVQALIERHVVTPPAGYDRAMRSYLGEPE